MACCDALGIDKLDNGFRRSLDDEFNKKAIPRLDFGSGVWGEINSKTKDARKKYTHFGVDISDRFPPVSIAEEAIKTIREAIHDIYEKMGKQSPAWVDFDEAKGWPIGDSFGFATLTAVGADPNNQKTLRIALVTEDGAEKVTNTFPGVTPEEDVFGHVEDLLGKLNAPFREVRVYRGSNLLGSEVLDMRG